MSGIVIVGTASGSIKVKNVSGEIDFNTASGDVKISESTGEFEVSTASGDINATEVVLKRSSSFSAASGDVDVGLGKSPEYDLSVSTASGDSRLNFNSNPIRGRLEMTARARKGRIRAPFKFDDEEYYYKWDQEYVTKFIERDRDFPLITINTASGRAILLEK